VNIDERLEGLTHSVELLAGMQIETEKRMAQLLEQSTRLQDAIATMAEGVAQITRVVLDHDQRIDNLEGRQTQQ
jgi:hypothetical protein